MDAIVSLPPFDPEQTLTLGYGIADWIEGYLLQPDGDTAGEPFVLTDEQLRFLLWYYAVDDRGRFLYRRAVLRRAKGWGKSPFLAALCLAELLGPVRFSHVDEETGEAVGQPHPSPWVVIAGVSETQTENTMAAIRAMSEDSALVEDYGLDIGLTRILTPNGKLHPITASSSTQEGARPSFAVMDETHHWTKSNGGWALAKVIRRNLAKSRDGSARSIETTNAHEPGAESVAEGSFKAWRAQVEGRARDSGLLYDVREAPPLESLADEALLREALLAAYGDATWLDLDRLVGEVYDPDTPPEEARRFYLNQIVAAADAWITPVELEPNKEKGKAAAPLAPGTRVTLGFDGSLTDDSTVLLALRVSDGAPFILGAWEKPEGPKGEGWRVDKSAVRGLVDHAFATYDVGAFFSDVAYWETDVDAWRDAYGESLAVKATPSHAVAWDMRGHQADTVRAVEALHRSLTDREVPLVPHVLPDGRDGLEILLRHVQNARRRPNRWGISFGKDTRESPHKVDALAAWTLARLARTRLLGTPEKPKKRAGTFRSFA